MASEHHRWSYDEEPKRSPGRQCTRCGMESRRVPGTVSWKGPQEVRPRGGEWTAVAEVPPCTAPTQAVLYLPWKVPA